MTDLDRLEELLAKAGIGIGSEDPKKYMGARLSVYDCRLILNELRQLREIVREAGEVLEEFIVPHRPNDNNEDGECPHCGRDNEGYEDQPCADDCPGEIARALHNKIKEVMG